MKLSTHRQGLDQRRRAQPLHAKQQEVINESMRTVLFLATPTQVRYTKFLRVQQRDGPLDPVAVHRDSASTRIVGLLVLCSYLDKDVY